MRHLAIILIINFIFTCTLHAGTTYYSPDGKVVSKQQFEILQKEHAKKVQATRDKRKAEALAKQASQKKISTNITLAQHGQPIQLDQFGRPIKTPDGRWITYPDQERHDIPQVTFAGHTPSSAGNKSNKNYDDDKNDAFIDRYGRLLKPVRGGAIDLETGTFCPKVGDMYHCNSEDRHYENQGATINGEWDTKGNHYTPAGGGNKWKQDGTFMQKAAGGYIDTKTGQFVPAN